MEVTEEIGNLEKELKLLHAQIDVLCSSLKKAKEHCSDLKTFMEEKTKEEENVVWNVTQAAEFLKLSKQGVYQLVMKKKIPYFKVGAHLRFRMTELKGMGKA